MLSIQENESIHSLIFRTHVLNGVSIFNNVVTSKGLWHRYPSILESTLHFYDPVQDDIFFRLLNGINYFSEKNSIFSLSQDGYGELSDFFSGSKRQSTYKEDFEIKFCSACFSEQLSIKGFTHFKNSWLFDSHCDVHGFELNELDESTYAKCVKSLVNIYKLEKVNTRKPSRKTFNETKKSQSPSLAPCMGEELYKYSILRINDFPKSAFSTQTVSVDMLRQPVVLERIFQTLLNEIHSCYFELMKLSNDVTIGGGYINKNSIPITLIKATKSNCYNCRYSSCLANKTIKYALVNDSLAMNCELNLRILHDYSQREKAYTFNEKMDYIQTLSQSFKRWVIESNKSQYTYNEPLLR